MELSDRADSLPGMNDSIQCPMYVEGQGLDDSTPRLDNCTGHQVRLSNVVIHLNDNHGWTREQIATWMQDQHDAGLINIAFEETLFSQFEGELI